MNIYFEILSQLLFWIIVAMSLFICYEFYLSKDGKLRLLIIELFLAKVWCYGVAALFYLFFDFGYFHSWPTIGLRIVCNGPMMIVMVRLYLFIRRK